LLQQQSHYAYGQFLSPLPPHVATAAPAHSAAHPFAPVPAPLVALPAVHHLLSLEDRLSRDRERRETEARQRQTEREAEARQRHTEREAEARQRQTEEQLQSELRRALMGGGGGGGWY
jgi:hypothetical protein